MSDIDLNNPVGPKPHARPHAWIKVDLAALSHNYIAFRDWVSENAPTPPRVIAVVKANAYGHGAAAAAAVFLEHGAEYLAVTTTDEAIALRDAGISARILVFVPPLPEEVATFVDLGLDATVCEESLVIALSAEADSRKKRAHVQLKVDTGMGRLGILPDAALALSQRIANDPNVEFAGVYTHFARAAEHGEEPTRRQFRKFCDVLDRLRSNGIDPGIRHCANSAAALRFPEMALDAVRPGTILYGQYPSTSVAQRLSLKATWRFETKVVCVRKLPAGASVGYGAEHTTRRDAVVAVLPVGYADGFTAAPSSLTAGLRGLRAIVASNRPPVVTIRGRSAPVIGRVAMQTCTVDVTDIRDVQPGDIAVVPVRRIMASAGLARIYEE